MALVSYEAAIENIFRGLRGGNVSLDDAEAYLKAQIEEDRNSLDDGLQRWLSAPCKTGEIHMAPNDGIDWNQNAMNAAGRGANEAKREALHRLRVALFGCRPHKGTVG